MPQSSRQRRCLLLSYVFAPSVGGIETVSRLLAGSLAERGYEVRVVTATAADAAAAAACSGPFHVIRKPSSLELYRQLRWCHFVLQSNFSLKLAWPLAYCAFPKPWMVVHHTPISRSSGALSLRDRLKLWSLSRAQCYSVSSYLATASPVPSGILFNPYDDALFRALERVSRDEPLIFLGRLVPAKGVDVLLHALAILRDEGFTPRLTIVGQGDA